MNDSNMTGSCEEVRKTDIVDYLLSLGHHATRIRGRNFWYLSPLREERSPSFKVDRKLNLWYDFGTGQGGNIIDFATLLFGCSVRDALRKIRERAIFARAPVGTSYPPEPAIQILSRKRISSKYLLHYLVQRKISPMVAAKYCEEIEFSINKKTHLAIGFKNNKGGYELRNPWLKISNSPKDISSLSHDSERICVFEGFFDFLSYQTIYKSQPPFVADFLVLNSLAFLEKSRPYLEYHPSIHLFLDRDKAGVTHTAKAMSWGPRYHDESILYKGYKDLNQWMQHIGKKLPEGFTPNQCHEKEC